MGINAKDIKDFMDFLRNLTDKQIQGVYEKERKANRHEYAALAEIEAEKRGMCLD